LYALLNISKITALGVPLIVFENKSRRSDPVEENAGIPFSVVVVGMGVLVTESRVAMRSTTKFEVDIFSVVIYLYISKNKLLFFQFFL
jgi:hypothetical protein